MLGAMFNSFVEGKPTHFGNSVTNQMWKSTFDTRIFSKGPSHLQKKQFLILAEQKKFLGLWPSF
jgi:hypothetical protein